jgi:hypothetical protein
MALLELLVLLTSGLLSPNAEAPACEPQLGRNAELVRGVVQGGEKFDQTTPAGWIVRLMPTQGGWFLAVTLQGREDEDLSRLTPPWDFVPNPREIEGWHFRNADNTGPNDGSVSAPQELREFIFSPIVGQGIHYNGSAIAAEDVEEIRAFGQGWLWIDSYRLTPFEQGKHAAFEALTFSACVTWPSDAVLVTR